VKNLLVVIGGVIAAAFLGLLGWIIKMLFTIIAQTATVPSLIEQNQENSERIRALELAFASTHPDLYLKMLKVRPIGVSEDGKT
jgi:hypothetical protein